MAMVCHCHSECGGYAVGRMSAGECVIYAFFWTRKGVQAVQFAIGGEHLSPAGQYLVAVCLMAYVPHDAVFGRVEHIVQGYCQLCDTEAGGQMSGIDR